MAHPLTDDTIHTMWGKGDPSQKFEYRLARSAADWVSRSGWYLFEYPCQKHEFISELKKAMRPQENS